jgi:UDP-N-acetylmuramate dehydrogenase
MAYGPPSHAALAALFERLGAGARMNEPMANHTSIRVGGPADIFFIARGTTRLIEAIDAADTLHVPWRAIGAGSNLLVSDDGVDGLVVKVATSSRSWRVDLDGEQAAVEAEAGCVIASLARQLAQEGLAGLEWAINVPGTVGAAVVNNSGAFGSSTAECLETAEVYRPGRGRATMTPDQFAMRYRTSALKRGELRALVLAARFRLRSANKEALLTRMQETQRQRQATQPTGPSLGSMFANPPGDAAGRLIEAAGLKGRRQNGAEVSKLHANFMLNRAQARAREVVDLMRNVQRTVWEHSGHWLVPEVQLAGRWPEEEKIALQTPPGQAVVSRSERLPLARASN